MAEFNPDEYLSSFNPDEYLNYDELNKQKSKADILREQLRAEPWLQRNIKGAMTAPSNLLEGIKQGAYELIHAKNPLDVTTRGIPQKGYDTSKISENRIIASEAPLGALAGNVATYAPLAFAPGAQNATGAALYGAGAGLIQPTVGEESRASNAVTGALLGGVTPVASATKNKLANALLSKSEDLVYSALKPTQTQYKSGAAKDAMETILNTKGLYPTKAGVEKLNSMIGDLNSQIKEKVSNSTERIELQDVVKKMNDIKQNFMYQVNPQSDIAAIQASKESFLSHPLLQKTTEEGLPYTETSISVPLAQKMKQATYRSLGDKAYGEIGGASREAQKALARGLKEGVASKVELIDELNRAEGKLLNAQDVIERAANRTANRELGGLSWLMHPVQAIGYLAQRDPALKASLAKALYAMGKNKVPPGVVKGTQAATYAAIPELTQGEQ
jgi:hypothetical protein